jgi:predicted outer membrane repeat protein
LFNGTSLTLTDVTFEANQAGLYGGGMYSRDGEPELVNVVFEGNIAGQSGGGMYNTWSMGVIPYYRTRLVNVRFSGNQAANSGGGMLNHNASPDIRQATFSGNIAQLGGGMYNYGDGTGWNASRPTIYNSIFWHNQDQNGTGPLAQVYDDAPFAMSTITYSLVEGGCPPAGDASVAGSASTCSSLLSADPLFVRAPDPGDGDWATSADNDYGDLQLRPGSPAIDAGDTTALPGDTLDLDGDGNLAEPLSLDLAGNPRIRHDTVDMGAYETILFDLYLPLMSGD